MAPILDHPLRYGLANELHARPFPALDVPCTAVYIAIKRPKGAAARDRGADMAHLIALLDRFGAPHPQPEATHYSGQIGRHTIKWEQHTEFVTYTAFSSGLSERPFDPADFDVFPEAWLETAPGVRVTSALLRIAPWASKEDAAAKLGEWFVPESLAASRVLGDAAVAAGDFRIDPAGHLRFAIFVAPDTGRRRVGRIVQQMCEIETYKAMSMLGFARVKEMGAAMAVMDGKLAHLMGAMRQAEAPAEETLAELLEVSAQLEDMAAQVAFRFGATGAYEAIVQQRIEVLREERFDGRQTFADFMLRRYDPAMRTVKSAQSRLAAMADRAMRAGDLLRTRVDVERSAQNQKLLESMDRRADLQLNLQKTVEGLSVVAVSYYAVSLAGYLFNPLAAPLGLSKGEMLAAITVPVVAAVWWMLRRVQKRLH